jgi:hypothetical protein
MIRDLKAAVPSNWQTFLSNQVVQFKESRGIFTEVLLQTVVSSSDPKKAATA